MIFSAPVTRCATTVCHRARAFPATTGDARKNPSRERDPGVRPGRAADSVILDAWTPSRCAAPSLWYRYRRRARSRPDRRVRGAHPARSPPRQSGWPDDAPRGHPAWGLARGWTRCDDSLARPASLGASTPVVRCSPRAVSPIHRATPPQRPRTVPASRFSRS